MEKFNTILLLTFWVSSLLASDTIDIQPPISHVTVYLKGAQITRQGSIVLQPGKNKIILNGLSPQIDPQSIQVKLTDAALIESVSHDIDYLNKMEVSEEISRLLSEKIQLIDSIKLLKSYSTAFLEEKSMVLANKSLSGEAGLNVNVLAQTAAFYRQRLQDIENNIFENKLHSRRLKKRLFAVSQMLFDNQMHSELPGSVITIIASARRTATTPIEVKYLIIDAGWEPNYAVRVKEADQPLTMDYKASVFQNSGEDWNDVKLTLSTGTPFISHDKPHLDTYYLSFDNYYKKRSSARTPIQNGRYIVSGTVTGQSGEALIGATVLEKGTINGAITDFNGRYEMEISSGHSTVVISYVGFANQEVFVNNKREVNISLEEGLQLSEVVVTALGSTNYRIAGNEQKAPKKIIPLSIEKSQTTTQFEIEIPYTIPSDNEKYSVAMVQYEVPAQYLYTAVPKFSDKAYLTAQITNWYQYRFLNGDVHLFLKGVYQGDTYLNLETVEDTLALSIGIDEDIIIKRETLRDYTRTKIIGSNKKVTRTWQTIVKNNKSIPIRIIIEDQYPISKTNDIRVTLEATSSTQNNESTGHLKWDLKIPGGQSIDLVFQYSVRFSKKRVVIVE